MSKFQVYDFDGKPHKWSFDGYTPPADETRPRSGPHKNARQILGELFPLQLIVEEVILPGTRLAVDFFLPSVKLGIEVQGEQHYSYVPHFHGSILGFMKQKKNDNLKKDWFTNNNLTLILLDYRESLDEWRDRIRQEISSD